MVTPFLACQAAASCVLPLCGHQNSGRFPSTRKLHVPGGFKIMVEDKGGLGLSALEEQTERLIHRFQKDPQLVGVSTQ